MITSPASSALNLMNSAQHKAADATQAIARFPIANDEVGSAEYSSSDLVKPILSLKEAEIESSAAVKLLETDKDMIGSLFDAMS